MEEPVIRPFMLTGGRTRPRQEGLRIESLVQVRPGESLDRLRFETRRIVELCTQPVSLAELSGRMRVPLGVVRVLVSDLVSDGVLTKAERADHTIALLERIRDRVRAL
jgi:hypothetical protein